jgi:DNA-binding response OmpR family regulator/DNA-binding CsgD family transcriptional regulator
VSAQGSIILLVDDAPQSMGPLCADLEAGGYSVVVAVDGASALERLELVAPDAILLDAMMPGLDGFEVCRRIKTEAAWSHVPVIFMTGLSDTSEIVKGFEAGGVDYVVKPVRAQEVIARLATHLKNAKAVRMAREAVDVGGHGVLLVDAHKRLAWQSPQARQWLGEFFSDQAAAASMTWLHGGTEAVDGVRDITVGGRTLTARRLGTVGMGEVMWLLSMLQADGRTSSRLATASLTAREAEVLSWIAKGKTNRDVGDILGLSPRTVNKHLEHVFEKLGVETRAAAAALASIDSVSKTV